MAQCRAIALEVYRLTRTRALYNAAAAVTSTAVSTAPIADDVLAKILPHMPAHAGEASSESGWLWGVGAAMRIVRWWNRDLNMFTAANVDAMADLAAIQAKVDAVADLLEELHKTIAAEVAADARRRGAVSRPIDFLTALGANAKVRLSWVVLDALMQRAADIYAARGGGRD